MNYRIYITKSKFVNSAPSFQCSLLDIFPHVRIKIKMPGLYVSALNQREDFRRVEKMMKRIIIIYTTFSIFHHVFFAQLPHPPTQYLSHADEFSFQSRLNQCEPHQQQLAN